MTSRQQIGNREDSHPATAVIIRLPCTLKELDSGRQVGRLLDATIIGEGRCQARVGLEELGGTQFALRSAEYTKIPTGTGGQVATFIVFFIQKNCLTLIELGSSRTVKFRGPVSFDITYTRTKYTSPGIC
jgi:hypothetical protein